MIIRLSQKLNTKIKAGKLTEMPLDANPFADWSANLFVVDRTQYIILSNTATLYSCVMYGKEISNGSRFIQRAVDCIREFMEADGHAEIYKKHIAPSTSSVSFAKSLNRQVIGSMNELVMAAATSLKFGDTAPHDLGFHLNEGLLSALATEGRNYGRPEDAFKQLASGKVK
jgi:hypothetical protein